MQGKRILTNINVQLEKHSQLKLSFAEFDNVLNYLDKGNLSKLAKILCDKM